MKPFVEMRCCVCFLAVTLLAVFAIPAVSKPTSGPLRVCPTNPRYFADSNGDVVYLTGSHTWASFQERGVEGETPDFDYGEFLDFLTEHNHSFMRMWMWEHATWMQFAERETRVRYKPMCYLRTGPGLALDGEPKFDLTKFNPNFFQRLRERVKAARDRGLYVGVMLFQGFSVEQKGKKGVKPNMGNPWDGHPYHKENNINGIDGDRNHDGEGEEVHTLSQSAITRLQEAYVSKMIDTLNDLDNIIWEISNESSGLSTKWQYHMIWFIKRYEAGKPMQHPTWMTFQWSGHSLGKNQNLFNGPAKAVSPNAEGGYGTDPPDAQGSKVVILDTDHFDPWLKKIDTTWAWKCFLRGINPILMDGYRDYRMKSPKQPAKEFEPLRCVLGYTNEMAKRIDLAHMVPMNDLCKTGYCLANPGQEYLIYQPRAGVPFWAKIETGTYREQWFDPNTGKKVASDTIQIDGGTISLAPPMDRSDSLVWLKRKQ